MNGREASHHEAPRPAHAGAGQAERCLVCDGALRPKWDRVVDPQTREAFAIRACEHCGLGVTFPQPDDLAPYYGPAYHGKRHGFTESYCMSRRVRFVRRFAGQARGRALLDVGCGDGTFLLEARKEGWDVAGTEFNPGIARAAGLRVWTDIEQAAERAPYGCVTLWHSLEHMRDPRRLMERVAGMVAPGGVVLVAVPNAAGWQATTFGPRWFHLDVPRHLFHFGPPSLERLFARVGLRTLETLHLEAELDLFGWTQSALNAVFDEPNLFYQQLTGRRPQSGALVRSASFAAGVAVSALAVPLTAASAVSRRGAVLVAAAEKAPSLS